MRTVDRTARRLAGAVVRPAVLVTVATFVLAGAGACSSSGGPDVAAPTATTTPATTDESFALLDAACAGALPVEDSGTVTSPALTEVSGIAASRVNVGDWWVHNDSGDSARFFLIDVIGTLQTTVTVDGAAAHDWEDIAIGPPVAESGAASVYLADIGDNGSSRADIEVYRTTEPIVPLDALDATTHVGADRLTFTYPDGPHDAETFMVDPDSGDLIIVTKDWSLAGHSNVYRAPAGLAAGSTTVLEKVAALDLPPGALVTGGDASPSGRVVALRTYGGVSLYPRAQGQPLWSAFAATPCAGPPPQEKQGEAIGFASNDSGYATMSEGERPVLHLTSR